MTSFTTVSHLVAVAPVADQYGWHGMSFSDHVVNLETTRTPYPYTEDGKRRWPMFTDWPDPWVLAGSLATITQQLRLR
jgi:alkanesulfonate monooxygenase SsuD/methylene tetrahydromethanopterin reductase-like flavin-dependent oxidoreductase (luciferase family)